MTLQEIMMSLQAYWAREGCLIAQPYDLEKGAGTFNPATFFGVLTRTPMRVAYVEPSRRPSDGRYGDNPNRLAKYFQYQVVLKPAPADVQQLYLRSLKAIGLDPRKHDVRWIEDDWESPTLGASGVGWEVWLDGMEVTQFTYFQQMAGVQLEPISVEITYGLERLAMYSQRKDNVYELAYNDRVTYGDVFKEGERQFSRYHFESSDAKLLSRHFDEYEREGLRIASEGMPLAAYDMVLKCSHLFNLLDARGAISVTERAQYIARVRGLAKKTVHAYLGVDAKPADPAGTPVPEKVS
ncbi:MAG: glycine--tRNA ligase subunit alpha [Elusimicrobia bacterium GWA2_69_24]|nr:MAG: glycine--tRNA ligase subunit alpha [Elusimicrobia bacterium GWA2_69_24]HBL17514.1 glycine--tRNA ligase subunit alpha [Elusimicrobiota bacterium]